MKNQALYIIKPEAIKVRKEIRDYIENHSGLVVVDSVVTKLDNFDINEIFVDDRSTLLIKAIRAHLSGRDVEVSIVELRDYCDDREKLIKELLNVTGLHFTPSQCTEDTVRFRFGTDHYKLYHGIKYYLNAIHRTGLNESEQAIMWFNNQFPKKR